MSAYQAQLARWLQLLATKGVQELVLVNRPWPLDVPLRAVLFGIASIGCLYIGLWKFEDVARLLPCTSFHHLRELGICSVVMEDEDIDFVVAESPILETLRPQYPWMQQGAAPSLRQPEPPVRPNLQLCSGGHRRGEGSSPRAAHPGGVPRQHRRLVHQGQDWRCSQAARGILQPGNTILVPGDARQHRHGVYISCPRSNSLFS